MKNIRNFCIIAHIDHGKSTLADRMLEVTGTIDKKSMRAQILDDMDLEREKGITIKSHAIRMCYSVEGQDYVLNLIDTPGHVDFSYEVSRSVAACEGALMVVDAQQGIEAQTLANLDLAMLHNLVVIPVLNKIDMPSARIEEVSHEIIQLLGCRQEDILQVSAKKGIGIEGLLKAVVHLIPPPQGDVEAPLQAMVFDAVYDAFRGVKSYFRIFNGKLHKKEAIKFLQTENRYQVEEVGVLTHKETPQEMLSAGEVGYMIAGIKSAKEVKIGDTFTTLSHPCSQAVAGFEEVRPMVFAGIYPVTGLEYDALQKALEKLQLNDASLVFQPESSSALGSGFRCGFLGMLHMEIVKERLSRENDVDIVMTTPSVELRLTDTQGKVHMIRTASEMLSPERIHTLEEPMVRAQIITLTEFVGKIIELCMKKRAVFKNQIQLSADRVELVFKMPLGEIIFDFFDKLKSISRGYASFEYHPIGFEVAQLVRLDILLNGEKVDALSSVVHRDHAYDIGKKICEKAKEVIPRHLFEVPIQAAISSKIIARVTIKALRKDVTAKLYGGHVERKKKLLEAQKKGKKRMKAIGKVQVPSETFLHLLRVRD